MIKDMQSNARILAVIPARGGSKGILDKNLKTVFNKPLLSYPIDFLRNEDIPVDILVSTDSKKIADLAFNLGVEVHNRSAELATDQALTEPVLAEALNWKESKRSRPYDYCIFLTTTSLFRPIGILERAFHYLESHESCESYFTAQPTTKNFWYITEQGEYKRIFEWMESYGSRQDRKSILREDTGIFSLSRAKIWRSGRRIGDNVKIELFDNSFSSIDLHEPKDLALAETAMRYTMGDLCE